jgi:hypothetical protein
MRVLLLEFTLCERQTMCKEIGVVHPRYLWKYLLYTDKVIQPLKHFLQAIHIATRRWYLGQYCNDEHVGQGDIRIAGQGNVNDWAEEHQSEAGGNDNVEDDDEEGEGVE